MRRSLFLCFLVSGFCGLLYQVVWVRLAFAHFGVITQVLSVVVSVFMAGLALGNYWGGKNIGPFCARRSFHPLKFYALVEALIGLGAFAVPHLLTLADRALLPSGVSNSATYLLWSAVGICVCLLPWCFLMGMTFPAVLCFLKAREPKDSTSFSFLYLANVVGALVGTLLTAMVLIELFGFQKTLMIAGLSNFCISIFALSIAGSYRVQILEVQKNRDDVSSVMKQNWGRSLLFMTGLTSMGMEVVWTRAFTPVLQTRIYAFAKLLAIYLLATWLGSRIYRKHVSQNRARTPEFLTGAASFACLLPVVMNDPRLHSNQLIVLLSIFPFCFILGYLTPLLIDLLSEGRSEKVAHVYGWNIVGSIIGPLIAGYALLPMFGVNHALLILSAPLLLLSFLTSKSFKRLPRVACASVALFIIAALIPISFEDVSFHKGVVRRDYTATVISTGEGMKKRLLVNGYGITELTTITKVMAHLPLITLGHNSQSNLVICFGMGTTFRSLMTWGSRTTAVELAPGVAQAFDYYHSDAAEILNHPNGRIVIDDGRRFLNRTTELFDVVTIDPPPPIQAAGSSLLYSEEFYELIRGHLTKDGILQQWYPGKPGSTLSAVARSILNSFSHVRVFKSFEGWGYHFLASQSPIVLPSISDAMQRMPTTAQKDLVEWSTESTESLLQKILASEIDINTILDPNPAIRILDDTPLNEYYVVRKTIANIRGQPTY